MAVAVHPHIQQSPLAHAIVRSFRKQPFTTEPIITRIQPSKCHIWLALLEGRATLFVRSSVIAQSFAALFGSSAMGCGVYCFGLRSTAPRASDADFAASRRIAL